jgi:hypothetical protein
VVEPATTSEDAASGGSSLLTSPVVLAVALFAVGGLFLVYRRRAGSNPEPQVARATVEPAPVAAEPVPVVHEADHEPTEVEPAPLEQAAPVELPKRGPERRSRFRRGAFERRQTSEPTPIRAAEWSVVVRGANGDTRRVDVGYDPVSIGASRLCTVTLDGDAVRFVHLVIAREGREVKAHQFGPVTVNGQETNVEDQQILTDAVMEIGDVSIWLERAVLDAAVSGAA